MSDVLTPDISGRPLQTATRRSVRRERFAWLLILAIAALIVVRNSSAETVKDSALVRKATAQFRSMILIGTASMQRTFGGARGNLDTSQLQTAVRQSEEEAQGPAEKLLAAIVAGEIVGAEPALTALSRISAEGNTELTADITAVRSIYAGDADALSAADKDRLIQRHGDYGRIALAFGVAPNKEPRKSVEEKAWRVLMVASAAVLGMILAGVFSIAVCVAGIVLRARNKIQRAYNSSPLPDATYLEAFALYLIFMIGFGALLRLFGLQSLNWNFFILLLVPALVLLIGKRTGGVQQVLRAIGLHPGRGWRREIGAGVIGYVAGLAFIVPCLLAAYFLMRNSGSAVSHPIMTPLLTGNAWQVLGFYGIACIVAPVTEETVFRGILFHHLRSRWSWGISSLLISLIFAVIHPQGLAAVPALGAIALVLAAIREWRGSLIASMTAHALNNFVSLTFALVLLKNGSF